MQLLQFTLILSKLSLQGLRNNLYEPSGLLNVDEDVEFVVSKQKLKIVLFALNTTLAFSPVFLLQNAVLTFKHSSRWKANCALLLQNAMIAFRCSSRW